MGVADKPGTQSQNAGTDSDAGAQQLTRILASQMFIRSPRLSALLRFIVEETIQGRGAGLKEQVIAAQLYGKPHGFDPSGDPTVRVDARRLRDKLREYYQSEGAADPIHIDIPKGRYVAQFLPLIRAAAHGNAPLEGASPSIAVLPFENLSNSADQEYFADGMTEGVITELAKLRVPRVISRTSVMSYKRARKPLGEIARELNVTHIVEGSVLRRKGRIRITWQLIQANPEDHLWAESYDRDLHDVLRLLAEIAHAVANQVHIVMKAPAVPARSRTIAPQAYEAYLKGRHHFSRLTPQDLYKSLEYFQVAIDQDPTYAPAFAGLADAYVLLGELVVPTKESHPKARAAAQRALKLDPDLAEAWNALAGIAGGYDWDWGQAEAWFQRAIDLSPNYALAHMWYASLLAQLGRFEDATRENRIAHALDPLSAAVEVEYGMILYVARQFEDAVRHLRATLRLDPAYARAYLFLGLALIELKRYREAIHALASGRRLAPHMSSFLTMLTYVHARTGQRAKAVQFLDELEKLAADAYVPEFMFAVVAIAFRDHDRAVAYLDRAFEERNLLLRVIGPTPIFDDLRDDPRFIDIVKRMNFPSMAP